MISSWFRNLPVKRKISLLVGFFSVLLIAMLSLAIKEVRGAQLRSEAIYHNNLLPTGDLTVARTAVLRAMVLVNNHLRAPNPAAAAAIEADMNKMDQNFDAAWERYQKGFTSEVAQRVGPQYQAAALEQRRVRLEALALSKQGDLAGAKQVLSEKVEATDRAMGPLGAQLVKDNAELASTALKLGQAQYRQAMIGGITFSILGILIGSLLGIVVIKGIHDPLQGFSRLLGSVSRGDLTATATLDRQDEFGQLGRDLNTMVADLRKVLLGVRGGVEGVASGATQLSASADQMAATSSGIAKISSDMRTGNERMAAAVTELSASIDEVNLDAQSSLERLERALELTGKGQAAGASTRVAMGQIAGTAGQISEAVNVIQEIANQTNLLSLNAAIEAAKAGEHGKGFSVVAEEVRKLAERSGSSAKQVALLITAARNAVEQGEATVGTTVATLEAIRAGLDEFASQTRRVATATVEQARAGADVARQVEAGSQEAFTVANAIGEMTVANQEVARTASDLTHLSEDLQRQVSRFSL